LFPKAAMPLQEKAEAFPGGKYMSCNNKRVAGFYIYT
jgi:hypothetical protein